MVRIIDESYRNLANDVNKRALRKAVDIINKYIDEEAVYLLDVLDKNSNTYWDIEEYVGSDWNLDADAIIADWESDQRADHEYDINPTGWDPRISIFNILYDVVGYDYDEAERILNINESVKKNRKSMVIRIYESHKSKKSVREARIGRTKEVKVLQGNWGYGWDDLCEYDKNDNGECRDDLRAYRENDPSARYRVIFRRVPNKDYVPTESVKKNRKQEVGRTNAETLNRKSCMNEWNQYASNDEDFYHIFASLNNSEELRDEFIDILKQFDKEMNSYDTDVYLYIDEDTNTGSFELFTNVGGNSWLDDDHITVYTDKQHYDDIFDYFNDLDYIADTLGTTVDTLKEEAYSTLDTDLYDFDDVDYTEIVDYIKTRDDYMDILDAEYDRAIDDEFNDVYADKADAILYGY